MPSKFASGRWAISQCDRCNFRFPLKILRRLVIKTKNVNILVCPECWEPDQPQLQLGMYPVNDPQALRNPRPDSNSYITSGVNVDGNPSGGSRIFQWGYAPVGGARANADGLTPNNLALGVTLGTVTVTTT
jgi:hypothetical protein